MKGNTCLVEVLHQYFEGSHVPDCRGVFDTPHRRPRRIRKRDIFLKGNMCLVEVLHRYFEGAHVFSCRGVLYTPHHTPPTVAYTDPFFEPSHVPSWRIASVFRSITRTRLGNRIGISKNRTYPIIGAYRIRPTSVPEGDKNETSLATVGSA